MSDTPTSVTGRAPVTPRRSLFAHDRRMVPDEHAIPTLNSHWHFLKAHRTPRIYLYMHHAGTPWGGGGGAFHTWSDSGASASSGSHRPREEYPPFACPGGGGRLRLIRGDRVYEGGGGGGGSLTGCQQLAGCVRVGHHGLSQSCYRLGSEELCECQWFSKICPRIVWSILVGYERRSMMRALRVQPLKLILVRSRASWPVSAKV